jgi:hypothetical protein
MKRRDVIKKIGDTAKRRGLSWELDRNGANHDVYTLDGLVIPIPRHREIGEQLAVALFKECESKLGRRWWR